MTPGRTWPTFRDLCRRASERGLHVEITIGGPRGENKDGEKDPGVIGRFLGAIRITDDKRKVLTERAISGDEIDKAAAGCLAYLNGVQP